MAWHTIKHSCGHEERHQLYGPGKTRTWRAGKLAEEPCEDCAKAEREAANAAAASENAANGLPPLTGSEKQVTWAETVRANKLDVIGRVLAGDMTGTERVCFWGESLKVDDPAVPCLVDALQRETAAHWWIDHRDLKTSLLLTMVARAMPAALPPAVTDDTAAATALIESTLRPAIEHSATVADIRIEGQRINLLFPEKLDAFRDCAKARGYRWDEQRRAWYRLIDEWSGPLADRAAEIGNALLAAGICIRIQDPSIRAAAVSAAFAPERKRWVRARDGGPFAGWLVLTWGRDDDLYASAKALPGARYDKPVVVVPAAQYAAVEDFAEAWDLAISAGARKLLDTARQVHEQALLAVPKRAPRAPRGRGPMPPVADAVDASLMDSAP